MVRKIIYNVEMIIKKSKSYTYVFEKVDNEIKEHCYINDRLFSLVICE